MFDVQHAPTPKDLFIIMLQVSRFFKEFAEFETKHTPKFRHPLIRDKIMQRKEEVTELKSQEMRKVDVREFLAAKGDDEKDYLEQRLAWPFAESNEEENFSVFDIDESPEDSDTKKLHYLYEIGLNPEIRRMNLADKMDERLVREANFEKMSLKNGLLPHEEVNIEVESGRVHFGLTRTSS
jgi:hypothetical protein